MEVPVAWREVDGSPWVLEGQPIGLSLTASVSVSRLDDQWDTPGVFFGVTDQFDVTTEELLDAFDYNDECSYGGRQDYSDAQYAGHFDIWTDCGDAGSLLVVVGVKPADGSYLGLVLVKAVSEADLDALDHIMNSFIYRG